MEPVVDAEDAAGGHHQKQETYPEIEGIARGNQERLAVEKRIIQREPHRDGGTHPRGDSEQQGHSHARFTCSDESGEDLAVGKNDVLEERLIPARGSPAFEQRRYLVRKTRRAVLGADPKK